MKRFILILALIATVVLPTFSLRAQDAKEREVTERLDDIEAYLNNGARNATTNSVSKIPGAGPGHNAWLMTCAALVLFMTLPGLALFYGGLVRRKNVLSVLAQCFGIAGLVAILWWLFGYSFVFADGASPWVGDFKKFFMLAEVDSNPNTNYSYWVSENVFSMYQMMFAIITPALI